MEAVESGVAATMGLSDSPWLLPPTPPEAGFPALNPSQEDVLSLHSRLEFVQGPPGTGKSATITAICQRSIATGHRLLVCATSNHAVDALASKFKAAGFTHVLAVGSLARMGDATLCYTLRSRLQSHPSSTWVKPAALNLEARASTAWLEGAHTNRRCPVAMLRWQMAVIVADLPVPGGPCTNSSLEWSESTSS